MAEQDGLGAPQHHAGQGREWGTTARQSGYPTQHGLENKPGKQRVLCRVCNAPSPDWRDKFGQHTNMDTLSLAL